MARITVEDCLKRIPNRFQLTLAATYRARQLAQGGSPMVEGVKDKPTVTALREVASRTQRLARLRGGSGASIGPILPVPSEVAVVPRIPARVQARGHADAQEALS